METFIILKIAFSILKIACLYATENIQYIMLFNYIFKSEYFIPALKLSNAINKPYLDWTFSCG